MRKFIFILSLIATLNVFAFNPISVPTVVTVTNTGFNQLFSELVPTPIIPPQTSPFYIQVAQTTYQPTCEPIACTLVNRVSGNYYQTVNPLPYMGVEKITLQESGKPPFLYGYVTVAVVAPVELNGFSYATAFQESSIDEAYPAPSFNITKGDSPYYIGTEKCTKYQCSINDFNE